MGSFVSDPMYVDNEEEEYLAEFAERLKLDQRESYRALFVFYLKLFCLGLTFIAIDNYWNLGMNTRLMECLVYILLPGLMLMLAIVMYC